MCYILIGCTWLALCTLNMNLSFYGMVQGDKGNIKINLGITSLWQLNRFYHCILSLQQNSVIQHKNHGLHIECVPTWMES